MKTQTPFSKPSVALGTVLTDRYRYNPYVKSTVHIILLQVALTLLIVVAFSFAMHYQQAATVRTVNETVGNFDPQITTALKTSLAQVRDTAIQYLLLGLVLLTAFFGYIAARFALRPTRDSLQFQKRFIGNMAHEVRTPLAIIKTNTEVALMDPRLDSSMRDMLNTTLGELDRISETINNLLSFDAMVRPSRSSFGEIDLTMLVEEVVDRHRALADSRGIDLSYRSDGGYRILGNSTGIEQVLTNIIKNALNYTPQHADGKVDVSVQDDSKYVKIAVTDTGIGIAQKDLYYIFQPFYRADTSRTRGVSGGSSGLGLAIVNEIVRHHNGKILVRSVLNRGTTIEVRLPKAKATEGSRDRLSDESDVKGTDLELS